MVAIAQYFFNDGVSGQSPGTVADSSGNSNNLTINFDTANAAWASNAEGGYLDVTAGVRTSSVNAGQMALNAGGLGAALEGLQAFTIILKVNAVQIGAYPDSPILHIGVGDGGNYDIMVSVADSGQGGMIRFRTGDGGGAGFYGNADTIYAFVFDLANATESDRLRIYKRASGTTNQRVTGAPLQDYVAPTAAISGVNDASTFITFMNDATNADNVQGGVKFAHIDNTALSQADIFTAFDALAANDDADPLALPPVAITAGPTISNLTYAGFNVNVTVDRDAELDFLLTASGAGQPSEAAFDAATLGGAATADVSFQVNPTGMAAGNYDVWVRATDGDGNDAYASIPVTVPVQVPAINSVSGDDVILDGETTVALVWDNGATGTTGVTINGVAQTSYTVTNDTTSSFNFVWSNALYGSPLTLSVDSGYVTRAVNILPAAGRTYVTLGASYDAANTDLTALPALVTGDQVEYEDTTTTGNPVVIDDLGRITVTLSVSQTVGNITARAIDSNDGTLGNWVVFPGTAPDLTPDQFDLGGDATGQDLSSVVTRSFVLAGIDAGENVTVIATGSGLVASDGVNYGASIVVQVGATIYVQATSSASYSTTVVAGCEINGVSDSFNIITRAANAPTITQQPANQTVNEGDIFNFVVAATNAVSYQWYDASDDSAITGETGTSYSRASVLGDNGLAVYCVATSAEGGTSQTATASLTVTPAQQAAPGLSFAANAFVNSNAHPSNADAVRGNETGIEVWVFSGVTLVSYSAANATDASGILNNISLAGQTIGATMVCAVRFANGDGVPPFQVTVSDIS